MFSWPGFLGNEKWEVNDILTLIGDGTLDPGQKTDPVV